MISQSGSASPGGSTALAIRVRLRSELIITPSASAQSAPGSMMSAWMLVSVSRKASWVMTSSAVSSAAIAPARFGMLATGLVQMIQHALMRPARMSSNIATAPAPSSARIVACGRPQRSSTKRRSASTRAERWPGRPGPM
jgi:hypothetical protein